ncbi:MAG: prepilin-type N-terminal cleavage/methylation domain-containing protein [Coriobacteriia bacterium]|nr:prepilin-type N-terminal cleavage/methylation domain-containing protein [Coriobacteriia bacterium]
MKSSRRLNNKGFTLAELLIVVAIVLVLVAIAIPVFTSQLEKSREATDLANARSAYAEVKEQVIQGNTSYTKTYPLEQQVSDWESYPVTAGGVTVTESQKNNVHWQGFPGKGGSVTVSWTDDGILFLWSGGTEEGGQGDELNGGETSGGDPSDDPADNPGSDEDAYDGSLPEGWNNHLISGQNNTPLEQSLNKVLGSIYTSVVGPNLNGDKIESVQIKDGKVTGITTKGGNTLSDQATLDKANKYIAKSLEGSGYTLDRTKTTFLYYDDNGQVVTKNGNGNRTVFLFHDQTGKTSTVQQTKDGYKWEAH